MFKKIKTIIINFMGMTLFSWIAYELYINGKSVNYISVNISLLSLAFIRVKENIQLPNFQVHEFHGYLFGF